VGTLLVPGVPEGGDAVLFPTRKLAQVKVTTLEWSA
jgi:hypothetical protein